MTTEAIELLKNIAIGFIVLAIFTGILLVKASGREE